MYQYYVMKQMVNATVNIIDLWMHFKKLESLSAIASRDSYISFVLSNLSHVSITQ